MVPLPISPEHLEASEPGHLLALGELAGRVVSDWPRAGEHRRDLLNWPRVTIQQGDTEQAKADLLTAVRQHWSDLGARYDLAVVSVDTDPRGFDCAQSALALLRDVVARQVWVMMLQEGPRALEPADLRALGFAASGGEPSTGAPTASGGPLLFVYDVATYKRTPDWLNPKGWAHPQRWGKFRW